MIGTVLTVPRRRLELTELDPDATLAIDLVVLCDLLAKCRVCEDPHERPTMRMLPDVGAAS